jgi:hypothetical protein
MQPARHPRPAPAGPLIISEALEQRRLLSTVNLQTQPDTAPVIKNIPNASVLVGQEYRLSGSFVDPDAGDSFTASVNYGDGTGKQTLPLHSDKKFLLHHFYHSPGDFTVTVVVSDSDGQSDTKRITVDVGGKTIEKSLISLLEQTSPSASALAALLKQATPPGTVAAAVTAQQQLAAAISAALGTIPLDSLNAKRVALVLLGCVDAQPLTPTYVTDEAAELQSVLSVGGRNPTLVTAVINACANMIQVEQSA